MGGQGALRFSYKHPNTFPVVAAISPAIDYHHRFDDDEVLQDMYSNKESVRQDTATLHIHPHELAEKPVLLLRSGGRRLVGWRRSGCG